MTNSKKMRVIEYMSRGNGLTVAEARSRFGVQNFRAMISDIGQRLPSDYRVVREETASGTNRYFVRSSNGKRVNVRDMIDEGVVAF